MYIIPKEKIRKIESEVKPDYLKHVNKLVEQGISDAVKEVGTKIKFDDSCLEPWCIKISKDLRDSKSGIYYKKITESHPDTLMAIYEKFRNEYNYNIIVEKNFWRSVFLITSLHQRMHSMMRTVIAKQWALMYAFIVMPN